jgi:hypothetical protein
MQQLLDHVLDHVDYRFLESEGFRKAVTAENCILLAHIHILSSTIPFFRRLLSLGFAASAIVVVPKSYSTMPAARAELERMGCHMVGDDEELFESGGYDRVIQRPLSQACELGALLYRNRFAKRCILVDDGGALTESWWRFHQGERYLDTISVQQTSSGWFEHRFREAMIRRVNVAGSAAKRLFESRIIVSGVLRKVASLHILRDFRRVAVVGVGNVGKALAHELFKRQKIVTTFDKQLDREVHGCERAVDWTACVKQADVIFGCTGRDFMDDKLHYLESVGAKHFISLSSRDVEFRSLLTSPAARRDRRFGGVVVRWKGAGPFVVLNGGFPINFDREREWEDESEIGLTRALVLLGVVQALCLPARRPTKANEKLALKCQQILVKTWLKRRNKTCADYEISERDFYDMRWWFRESRGSEYKGKETSQTAAYIKE